MEDNETPNSDAQVVDEVEAQEANDVVDTEEESTDNSQEESTVEESQDESSEDDDAMVPLSKLKKVRNEAKNLRERLKTAEDRIHELEATNTDEALRTERDDYKQKYEKLVQQHRTEKVTRLVTDAATKQGAIEPAAVAKLVDQDTIEWKDGEPTNIADVVTNLKNTYKRLFGVNGTGNAGNRNERGADNEGLTANERLKNAYMRTND